MQHRALGSRARVIIFPETVVPLWTDATELFWKSTLDALRSDGKTVVIGAGVGIPRTGMYQNTAILRGAGVGMFAQRMPVPIGMWQPFGNSGVPLNLSGPGVVRIDGRAAAILICYEQLLTWPVLASRLSRPDIHLGLSNAWWARGTRLPQVQAQISRLWARLFQVPWISATNL